MVKHTQTHSIESKHFPAWIMFLPQTEEILVQSQQISPNFLVGKFCGNTQFPPIFEWIVQKSAKTVRFYKISTPEN